jgi:organic hydroperoxide reductase OsmC/OhrA
VSEHHATVSWERESADFSYESYDRNHSWRFEGGAEVAASAAPAFLGSADRVDPEEALVASISSCHMLSFLAIAARRRLVVDCYLDRAVGTMEKNEDGRLAVTRVVLRPEIEFGGDPPSAERIAKMHELSHRECFIANSVRTEIVVEAPDPTPP